MFEKILIANRGEIACRVIRTAKKLGIASVAVYSDADAQAQHVKQADQAVYIGASTAAHSYLNIENIIQAALSTGAQAIHPGYGFLSENAQFAQACARHGLVFIGPPVEAILAMGLKSTAKSLMEKAGVPLTPGYHGDNQDPEFLKRQADQIGYPILIKASAGGGGKGMRLVELEQDFLSSLSSCKSEAKASFANDQVLLERYITQPRHVEVQIFGDSHGNYVHLFERDCSVQRRHQKVLEEAPAPNIPQDKLEHMRQAAIDAARAVHYVGAGTVEFIVEQDGSAYFMEMNTRLQVEHPVTEMITGEDLVEWQLRVATGEALPKQQQQLLMRGHAIEARVYAEEPEFDFRPAIGKIDYLHYPEQSNNVRIDSGIVQGDEITSFYDPMIAKLIVWAPNRDSALLQMHHALAKFHICGVGNNIAFLDRLIRCNAFKQAHLDTNLIQREQQVLLDFSQPVPAKWVVAAAAIELQLRLQIQQQRHPSLWNQLPLWRLNIQTQQQIEFKFAGQQQLVQFSQVADAMTHSMMADYAGEAFSISLELQDTHGAVLNIDQQQYTLRFNRSTHLLSLFSESQHYVFDFSPQTYLSDDPSHHDAALKAPMPGLITQLFVAADAQVKKGEILLSLEAMKIEYSIRAPQDGVVSGCFFQVGDQVKAGDELIDFQASPTVAEVPI